MTGKIDLAIPRGGEGLIRAVTEQAHIPVIKHYKGVCHVYVDGEVDQAIEYLQLSVSNSKNNNYQKSTSALELADLYFSNDDYTLDQTVRLVNGHLKPLIAQLQQQQRHISSSTAGVLLTPRDLHRMVLHASYWRHPNLAAAA